jgi:hypothetical protein
MTGRAALKFKLAHRGLLLVGVPLLLELALFGWMLALVEQADAAADRALKSKEIVRAADILFVHLVAIADTSGRKRLIEEKRTRELDQLAEETHTDIAQLSKMLQGDEDGCRRLKIIDQSVRDHVRLSYQLLKIWNEQVPGGSCGGFLTPQRQDAYERLFALFNESQRVFLPHNSRILQMFVTKEDEPALQSGILERAKVVLIGGAALSIIVTLALAVFFLQQILRRLRIMTENNKRFLAGSNLSPIVSGSDEIADVDIMFHETVTALNAARENDKLVEKTRDGVVAMVTHDLRTPLQTVSVFLEYMEGENLEQDAEQLRNAAQGDVATMGQLINKVLHFEESHDSGLLLQFDDKGNSMEAVGDKQPTSPDSPPKGAPD